MNLHQDRFEQIVHNIDPTATLRSHTSLKGGVSAQVTLLEILSRKGLTRKMIVRQHGEADLLRNPNIAADEYRLLQVLTSKGLAVPAPYYLDLSCEIFPAPYLVMEYIEGSTIFEPTNVEKDMAELAIHLARIHRADYTNADLFFLPKQEDLYGKIIGATSIVNNELAGLDLIRDTLAPIWPLPSQNHPVILHGDYWPGNVLWKEGELVAVIDWEDAAQGDPLADLANARLEVLFHFGVEAMNYFTYRYQLQITALDYTNLPYWELGAALRLSKFPEWGLDQETVSLMRERHQWFATQSLRAIEGNFSS